MSTEAPEKNITTVVDRSQTGQCPVCESSRKWGDSIIWNGTTWIHEECPRDEEISDLGHGFCDTCFLTKHANGACSCTD